MALSFAVAQLDYVGQVAWALEERGCTASTAPIGRSGKDADRPELARLPGVPGPGDTLVVPRWTGSVPLPCRPDRHRDRAPPTRGRVQGLNETRHHHPRRRLVFHVFAALAEFIRELIRERTAGTAWYPGLNPDTGPVALAA